jgi:hypothetical protein
MNTFYIRLGDANPLMEATLSDAAGQSIIESGDVVKLYVLISGEREDFDATVIDAEAGTVRVQFATDTFTRAGQYNCYFQNESKDMSAPNAGYNQIIVSDKFAGGSS